MQSWTDSHESLLSSDGAMPPYPIAPVEVQADTHGLHFVFGRDFINQNHQIIYKIKNLLKD